MNSPDLIDCLVIWLRDKHPSWCIMGVNDSTWGDGHYITYRLGRLSDGSTMMRDPHLRVDATKVRFCCGEGWIRPPHMFEEMHMSDPEFFTKISAVLISHEEAHNAKRK